MKKMVTVISNMSHGHVVPVGGRKGTLIIPGENQIEESVWAACLQRDTVKTLIAAKRLEGPAEVKAEPAPSTSAFLEADKAKLEAKEAKPVTAATAKAKKAKPGDMSGFEGLE